MLPKHSILQFTAAKNAGLAIMKIQEDNTDEEVVEALTEFFDNNLKRHNKKTLEWVIRIDEAHAIIQEVESIIESFEQKDDESDDELIAEADLRRSKQMSSFKEIDDESTQFDSDDENVTKLCRRIRHVYKVLAQQREEIQKLRALLAQKK